MAVRSRAWRELRDHLEVEMRRQGWGRETYDPDFILGSIQAWLGTEDAALTVDGVRRFRRKTVPTTLGEPARRRGRPRRTGR